MKEEFLEIATPDGTMDTFLTHPAEGGPFSAVVVYMDVWGLREELYDIARRIATVGFVCVVPNLYYRKGKIRFDFRDEKGKMMSLKRLDEETQKRVLEPHLTLTNAMVMSDTRALIERLKSISAARIDAMGSIGYCMGGRHVMCAAGHFPEHFVAGASLHGTYLISDAEDSPHHLASRFRGELYCGFGATDPYTPPALIKQLDELLSRAAVEYRYLVHEAEHGYALPDRDIHDKLASNRDWVRIFSMFRRRLHSPV